MTETAGRFSEHIILEGGVLHFNPAPSPGSPAERRTEQIQLGELRGSPSGAGSPDGRTERALLEGH